MKEGTVQFSRRSRSNIPNPGFAELQSKTVLILGLPSLQNILKVNKNLGAEINSMSLLGKHGLGGLDQIKVLAVTPVVETSIRFKFQSYQSSEIDSRILRLLEDCFLYSLCQKNIVSKNIIAFVFTAPLFSAKGRKGLIFERFMSVKCF